MRTIGESSAALQRALEQASGAYMEGSYGWENWSEIAEYLLERFTSTQVAAILRSKIMRWANDYSNGYALSDFKRFMEAEPSHFTMEEVRSLTKDTFGVEE